MANILVIDDEQSILSILDHILVQANHNCHVSNSIRDSISALDIDNFDIVLLDLRLNNNPNDSVNLCEYIKVKNPKTKVICISGYIDKEYYCFDAHLQKPFNTKTILSLICELLGENCDI